jgi:hypothetical protein
MLIVLLADAQPPDKAPKSTAIPLATSWLFFFLKPDFLTSSQ